MTAKNESGEGNASVGINLQELQQQQQKVSGMKMDKPTIRLENNYKTVITEIFVHCADMPTMSWTYGTTAIKNGGRYKIEAVKKGDGYNLIFRINDLTNKDSGTYKCLIKSKSGEGTATVNLNLEALRKEQEEKDKKAKKGDAPKFTQTLTAKTVNDGDAVDFVAKVTGTPPIDVFWYKAGKEIKKSADFKITFDEKTGTCKLSIVEAFPEDSGEIKVEAVNDFGEVISKAQLIVKEPKDEKKDPKKKDAKKPPVEEEIIANDNVKQVESAAPEEGKDLLKKTQKKKPGEKSDKTNNDDEPQEEVGKFGLKKRKPPRRIMPREEEKIEFGPHMLKKTPQQLKEEKERKEREAAQLELERKGYKLYEKRERPQLEEKPAAPKKAPVDESIYEAEGPKKKPAGKVDKSGDPRILEKLGNQMADEGKDLSVTVRTAGDPFPNIRWYKGVRELTNDPRVTISSDPVNRTGTISVKKAKTSDEGKYQVVLEHNGEVYDANKFSVYVKDPKDSGMDFRAMLKSSQDGKKNKGRESKKQPDEDDELDFGSLRPGQPRRRLSQVTRGKINLKGVPNNATENDADNKDRRKSSTSKLQVPGQSSPSLEDLEEQQRQRKKSEDLRRTSLADVIPNWPVLKHTARKQEKPDEFVENLADCKVMEGTKEVKFKGIFCKPKCKLRWYKNKLEIFQSKKFTFVSNDAEHELIIKNIDMSDAGRYTLKCNECQSSAWLNVEQKEMKYHFNMPLPEEVSVIKRKDITLECSVSDPRAHVKWYKNGEALEYDTGKMAIRRRENRCLLTISHSNIDDDGVYMCITDGDTTQTELIVIEPDYVFTRPLKDGQVMLHDSIPLRVEVDDEDARVRWYKNDEEIEPDGTKYETKSEGRERILVIRDALYDDQAEYSCAVGKKGERTTCKLYVTPDVKFTEKLHETHAIKKGPLMLACKANNPHKHPIKWYKNDILLKPDNRIQLKEEDGKIMLCIDECELDDEGLYTCEIGDAATECEVFVSENKIPPQMDMSSIPKEIKVRAGEKINWEVPFKANPAPIAAWKKNGQEIKESDHLQLKSEKDSCSLGIKKAKREDCGDYELALTNECGTNTAPVKIKVVDIPLAPEGPLEVSDVFKDRCHLKWKEPKDDGGEPIECYIVEKYDMDKASWVEVSRPKSLECHVPNLIPNHKYRFRVKALNKLGESEPLATAIGEEILAKDPYDEPSKPGRCEAVDWDKDFVDLEWDKPTSDGGNPIKKYIIEKKEKFSNDWVPVMEAGPDQLKAKVTAVKENTENEFRVKAVNDAGESEPSNPTGTIITKPRFVKPTIDKSGIAPIRVKAGQPFNIAVPFNGEPAPTAEWKHNDHLIVPSDTTSVNSTETKSTFNNKKASRKDGGKYTLTVKNGSGTDSIDVDVVVLAAPESPQGPLEISEITKEGCKLAWKPPKDDGGSDITGYVVEKLDPKKGTWEKVTAPVTGTKCTVPKLQEGHRYQFRVRAENLQGLSEPLLAEDEIVAKNPYDEPGSPGQPEIVDHNRDRIDLKWAEPKKDGGNPIQGYIIERKEPKSNRWVRINPDNLCKDLKFADDTVKDGKEYEYRVSAVNDAGPSEPSKVSKPVKAVPSKEAPKLDLSGFFGNREIKVRAGEPFEIDAPISGAPAPVVEWSKNGKPVPKDTRHEIDTTEENTKMRVPCAKREDTGKYTIALSNEFGNDSGDVNVIVLDRPTAPEGPLEVSDVFADNCKLSWKPPADNGGADIIGYNIEKCLANSDTWERVPGLVTGESHTVKDLEPGKKYKFRVMAENMFGKSEPLTTTKDTEAKNPYDAPDAPGNVEIGDFDRSSVQLHWKEPRNDGGNPVKGYFVEMKESHSPEWQRVNVFPTTDTKYPILNLREGRDYQFRVVAVNDAGPGKPSKPTESHTARDPIFPAGAPSGINVDKITKDNIDLSWPRCVDDGGAPIEGYVVEKKGPTGDWQKCKQVGPTELATSIPVTEGEQCQFRVRALNEAGLGEPSRPTDMITCENQPEKPKIDASEVKDVVVKAGQPFEIKVPFTGFPKPTAEWTLSDEPYEGTSRTYMKVADDHAILKTDDAKRCDSGIYKVVLKNATGQDTVKCRVKVLDTPSKPEGPLVPTDVQADQISLKWKEPLEDGGDPVNNYILEKRPVGSKDWQKVSSFISSPSATVRNLDEGTEYEFRVMAENKYGVSEPLVVTEPIKAKHPFDKPSASGSPVVEDVTEDSVTLAWEPPRKDGGAPITGYVVEKRKKGDKNWTKAIPGDCPGTGCTVKGLKEGEEYEFRVAAVNKAGPGDFSEITEPVKCRAPPRAPKIDYSGIPNEIVVKKGEDFKLKIPYDGSPMPEVTWAKDGNPVNPDDRHAIDTDMLESILGVKKATKDDAGRYVIQLKNEKGTDTVPINVKIVDAPEKPEGPIEVSKITPDSCTLKWSAPKDDGGAPVTNYIVEKCDKKSGKWTPCSRFVRGTSYDVHDLDDGHEYLFRVSAVNDHGESEPLEAEKAIVAKHQFATPDAPGKVEVSDVDEDEITLKWEKPEDDGGDKVQGYVIEMKPEGSNKWKPCNDFPCRGTQFTVDGLEKGKKYDFRVRAKNRAGLSEPSKATGLTEAKPKYSVPKAPGMPEVKNVGKNFVDLEWPRPVSDGGSRITGYIVEKKNNSKGGDWEKASDYNIREPRFTVSNLPEGDDFEFRVIAVNAAGQSEPSECSMPVKVKEKIEGTKPEVLKKLDNCLAPVGGEATFTCMYDGKPPPTVKWYRNGSEIFPTSRAKIKTDDDKTVLTLSDIGESDAGEITCELSNKLGRDESSAKLTVQKPPQIEKLPRPDQTVDEGDSLKIKIPFSGTGPFDVKLKKNGKEIPDNARLKCQCFDDYAVLTLKDANKDDTGDYKIEISNPSGSAVAPINLKVKARPGKCNGLDVSDITKNTCSLSWKAPKDDGGSKITHYMVEKKLKDKPYWGTVASYCKEPYCDVQGLYENEEYFFRVCAVNANGEGEYLETANAIVAKMPYDAPGSPGVPDIEEVGADFVSLQWEKPHTDGGGKITSYIIEKREPGSENWTRVNHQPVVATIFNVPNLIEDKEYEFRIFAENPAGRSKPSSNSRKVKVKDPNAAKIPEFTSPLRDTLCSEGKAAKFECEILGTHPDVTWFKGTREISDEDPKYEIHKDGDKHMLVVHDVFGEDSDEYSVRASNKAGTRTSRAELSIKSPPRIKVPERFKDVSTYEKGEEIVLKVPFTGNPKPTCKWIRDNEEIKSGGRHKIEVTERHAFLTIKKAEKEDEGPYRLTLENDLGTDSAVIKIQINDMPDPPRFPIVESAFEDVVGLSWKPPLNDGGSFITEYIVEKADANKDNWTRVGSSRLAYMNIQDLQPSTEYELRISAVNFYGQSSPCEPIKVKTTEAMKKRKGKGLYDEHGRKIRGQYDGPKITDYDKFYHDLWAKYHPQPVDVKNASIYDFYDILEELGSGAFGVVHRCREKATGKIFVAKFINTPFPLDKVTVRNEINVMNQLHHPKLINLHDAFDDGDDEMCLVMEFLSGGELFDRVAAEDYKMTEAEVINYIRQVCDGLKHMHDNCIVHLDIKPENIMCETGKSNNVKLIDFGLATKLDPNEIVKVSTATAEFAAPEVCEIEPVGYYTDMWSVGVLAYVLMSGLSPFAGEDDYETLQNVKRCDWQFDPESFKISSDEGKDFIKKLLVKTPQKRMTIYQALEHPWLKGDLTGLDKRIPSSRYDRIRQKIKDKYADWGTPMPAIGRIANFSSLRKHRPKEYAIYDTYFDRREAAPRFIRKPRNQVVSEGQMAKFDCKVIALSCPIITWYHDNVQLTQSVKHMQKYSGSEFELRINRCKLDGDAGEYIVRAENSFGTKEEPMMLQVEPMELLNLRPVAHEPTPMRKLREREIEMFKEKKYKPHFMFPLRNRILQEGTAFKLLATVEANPTPEITWMKSGRELRNSDFHTIKYQFGVCSLEVLGCSLEDAGKYSVHARNELGEDECDATIRIEADKSKERLLLRPKGLDTSGQNTSSSFSRMTRRTEGGTTITESSYSSKSVISSSSDSSDFRSSRRTMRQDDDSSFDSMSSFSTKKSSLDSAMVMPASIIRQLSGDNLNAGEQLRLSCSFSGTKVEIEWSKDGLPLGSHMNVETTDTSSTLTIPAVTASDQGDYTCKAKNSNGSASTTAFVQVSAVAAVNDMIDMPAPLDRDTDTPAVVNGELIEEPAIVETTKEAKPSSVESAPVFTQHVKGQILVDGDQLKLECRISANPPAEVVWVQNGREVKPSEDFKMENEGDLYRLTISEVFPEDTGEYSCEAFNSVGEAISLCTVRVDVPDEKGSGPSFETFPASVTVEEGSPAKFSCSIKSESPVEITWKKGKSNVEASDRIKVESGDRNSTLEILATLATDSGEYTAVAGTASWSFSLNVTVPEGTA
ncbi:twitchin-like [Tubulanus polymorphus]|uniref:twitchin-like n=1 Tax=Tubulanus polymorphus TaxID=672921 RepID=UPI003DA211D8